MYILTPNLKSLPIGPTQNNKTLSKWKEHNKKIKKKKIVNHFQIKKKKNW